MMPREPDRRATRIGPAEGPPAADPVRAAVERSRSSFLPAMRLLPAARRHAIHAVYAFCRSVDDIADSDRPAEDKLRALEQWRQEIDRLFQGAPVHPIAVALRDPVIRFGLPKAEFTAVIDGMQWDATAPARAPSLDLLYRYCRLVAGSVGLLAIRIFGARGDGAATFAITLGEALQLTNILRDIAEDAELGRLYVPAELLRRHGIESREIEAVLRHPNLPDACRDLEVIARQKFEAARAVLADCDRSALRPAMAMMAVYLHLLDRMASRGWDAYGVAVAPSRAAALVAAARAALLGPLWPRFI